MLDGQWPDGCIELRRYRPIPDPKHVVVTFEGALHNRESDDIGNLRLSSPTSCNLAPGEQEAWSAAKILRALRTIQERFSRHLIGVKMLERTCAASLGGQ
jgi:hypothetical protein